MHNRCKSNTSSMQGTCVCDVKDIYSYIFRCCQVGDQCQLVFS